MGKSKNNPANRAKNLAGKTFDGKPVKPVLYMGKNVGHGQYMAVQFEDGKMAEDESGQPIMWDAI